MEELTQLLLTALSLALGWLVKNAVPLLKLYLKERMHFRGSAVVVDSIAQAINHMSVEIQQRVANGSFDATDLVEIKAEAHKLAYDKLERLGGFYKDDLVKWVDEQVEIGLGKLLLSVVGKPKD